MTGNNIRTIMAPLAQDYVMLPASAVAEVVNFTSPKPLKNAPSWLLGELAWNGWQVPVINLEKLIKSDHPGKTTAKARILVVKTLGESTLVNYIGLVIQGLPRLKKVNETDLIEKQTDKLHAAVFSEVSIDDMHAIIPELSALTQTVEHSAYDT